MPRICICIIYLNVYIYIYTPSLIVFFSVTYGSWVQLKSISTIDRLDDVVDEKCSRGVIVAKFVETLIKGTYKSVMFESRLPACNHLREISFQI